ncbi:tigger transposable element-derived protein 4-like [Aphis craccivora]|uniref:Tigger transposable element-derived protein 4-like n=1 Tax=Aphis craccivora TaxID=307492 RepID=A0A6G0VZU4_APHCR|nr:tigger transposable element-derived protein 4-like [Aphis craccivora]
MCRHSGATSEFYLAQTYSKIPKQLVRDNSNLDFSEFRKKSHFCWNNSDYGFMVIDKSREMNEGRYRCGFHTSIKKI